MSGNVSEWEDSCNANASPGDLCRVRSGDFGSAEADLACTYADTKARNTAAIWIGFRCCADVN
jgi:formylglycine-generating enzyme required for sulfatase activity